MTTTESLQRPLVLQWLIVVGWLLVCWLLIPLGIWLADQAGGSRGGPWIETATADRFEIAVSQPLTAAAPKSAQLSQLASDAMGVAPRL